ncbi:MAG: hypothetical protein ACRD0J_00445 [Acidimicrobiales bacterium]
MLVLVVLGALAVDSAAVFLGQRQLASAAQSAATDATSALSQAAFYQGGRVELDPAAARQVALASVAAQDLSGVHLTGPVSVQVAGRQVCVSLTGTVPPIFGRAIPGIGSATTVRARATATAAGDHGPTVPHRAIC